MSTVVEEHLDLLPGFGAWRADLAPEPSQREFEDYFASLSPAEILSSDTCLACGGVKRSSQPICTGCRNLLPVAGQALIPPRVKDYITHPVEADSFKDRLKTAIAVVKERREERIAKL